MTWIPLIAGILALLGFSVYIVKVSNKELTSWFSTLVGSLSSILIGITIAVVIYDYQVSESNKSNKQRYINLLTLELSALNFHLNNKNMVVVTGAGNEKYRLHLVGLPHEVLGQAGLSGLFNEEISFMLLDLSSSIGFWNDKTRSFLGAINSNLNSEGYNRRIKWYQSQINKSRDGLLKGTYILKQKLNIEIITPIEY